MITLQEVIQQSLGVFFYDIPSDLMNYISIVAVLAIIGGLFALFLSIFSSRKNSGKIVILILVIAVSAYFLISHWFECSLDFENALSTITG